MLSIFSEQLASFYDYHSGEIIDLISSFWKEYLVKDKTEEKIE